jgi:hypothetical protein
VSLLSASFCFLIKYSYLQHLAQGCFKLDKNSTGKNEEDLASHFPKGTFSGLAPTVREVAGFRSESFFGSTITNMSVYVYGLTTYASYEKVRFSLTWPIVSTSQKHQILQPVTFQGAQLLTEVVLKGTDLPVVIP